MTLNQLSILQHTLGLDEYGRGKSYRNHFVTSSGSSDYADCCKLVELGFMQKRAGNQLSGGDDIFLVTDCGRMAIQEQSPEPKKLSRSAARYQQYLSMECNESFGEFLKYRWYEPINA